MNNFSGYAEVKGIERLVFTVQELSLARDIDSIMNIVKKVAREYTGSDGATFVLRDGEYCYYADEYAISPLWKGCRFPIHTCISGWSMENKEAAIIGDIYQDERIPTDVYRKTFVKSLVMVPIRKLDPLGAIGNYWAEHHLPDEEETEFLQALADITAVSIENLEVRSKLEKSLNIRIQMLDQITEQKNQLEELCHIIAHNLRAPISNLLLLNDLLKDTQSDEEKIQYIDKQKPVIDYLNEIFEELVHATQVRMDVSIEKKMLNLETSTQKIINVLHNEIHNTRAGISWDFSNAPYIQFHQKYLDSILYNLLQNAIKYRAPERVPMISLRSYKQDEYILLEITDNGLGLDVQKHANNLFKLRKTFHQHPEAKGFGLFITKNQIEAMGGKIDIKSTPGKGTTFILTIPDN